MHSANLEVTDEMRGDEAFRIEGEWLRGNLHTHTTLSDGELSPLETAKFYAERGYDFVALTDHNKLSTPPPQAPLLVLSGVEVHFPRTELGTYFHLVLVGLKQFPYGHRVEPQELVELTNEQGGLAILAHPYWSGLTSSDLTVFRGLAGVEIFNFSCLRGIGRGHSLAHWDELLERGWRCFGFAVDDAHFHYPDACGGWVWVKVRDRSPEAVLEALRRGLFYSSSGPTIEEFRVEGRRAFVKCSPAVMIKFVCQREYGKVFFSEDGSPSLREAEAELPRAKYVRVEVVDERGNTAWTNPVFFDESSC